LRGILGITGTPGTGKKSVAPIVARSLGAACFGIDELARAEGLTEGAGMEGEVDTVLLRKALARRVKSPAVLYGHLLPYSVDRRRVAGAVVLRCEPTVLKQRLMSRGYPEEKVLDNVRAELIGLLSADTARSFGRAKTFEVDTTYSTPAESAAKVVSIVERGPKGAGPIDWMPGYDSGPKLRSLLPSP
jgi:adenylate kinase